MNLAVRIVLSGCLLFALAHVPVYAMKQNGTFVTGKDLSSVLQLLKESKDAKIFELVENTLKDYCSRAYVVNSYDFEEKASWLRVPFEKAVKLLDLSEELIGNWRDSVRRVKDFKPVHPYLCYLCDYYLTKLAQERFELEKEYDQDDGF